MINENVLKKEKKGFENRLFFNKVLLDYIYLSYLEF